jgi:hypothetical protein
MRKCRRSAQETVYYHGKRIAAKLTFSTSLEIFRIDRARRADYFHIKILGVCNLLLVANADFSKKRTITISGVFTARACFQRFSDRLKNPNISFDSP